MDHSLEMMVPNPQRPEVIDRVDHIFLVGPRLPDRTRNL